MQQKKIHCFIQKAASCALGGLYIGRRTSVTHAHMRMESELEFVDSKPKDEQYAEREELGCINTSQASSVCPLSLKGNVCNARRICKQGAGLNLVYYSSFYRKVDADSIFQQLESQLQAYFTSSRQSVKMAGRVLQIPRRQTAFGDRGLSYTFSGITMQANPWTPLVSALRDHVERALDEKFNFVLVNRYKDGLDHIGEHRDDERDLERAAPIASLSFGQARDFVLRHKDARGGRRRGRPNTVAVPLQPVKIELGHGSLLVMCHPTNSMWYHSLPIRRRALHPRINLTFRRMIVREPAVQLKHQLSSTAIT